MMEFSVKVSRPNTERTDCIITSVFEGARLCQSAETFDAASDGYLRHLLNEGNLEGKLGQTLLLHQVPKVLSSRLLLVGCGRERELGDKEFRDIVRKAFTAILNTGAAEVFSFLTELKVKGRDILWKIRQSVIVISDILYAFDTYKTKKEPVATALRRVVFIVPTKQESVLGERGVQEGQAIAQGIALAKNLGNTPPNICTPIYLAKAAETLADDFSSIHTEILDERSIAALKMNTLLSVAQGSDNPPRFITVKYQGTSDKQKPIVLVGKGITFDTGGNSLKSPAAMIGMKYDMCGAAAVLGAIQAAAKLALPLHIIGLIPTAENMPGSKATRPDDIVTSLSGLTVEILNTDAEGRLILCDALTYAERFDPEVVIDIATLTGACAMTFGSHVCALLSNNSHLADALFEAGLTSFDRCWQLPLFEDYQEALNSNFADVANIGNPPEAGTILGACFLARFAEKYRWAHLDIAGTASRATGKERGATGRPVALLVQYLLDRC